MGVTGMVNRYKIYPYIDKQRNLNISKDLDPNGEWVRFKDCNRYLKEVCDDNYDLQKKFTTLKEQNKQIIKILEWYADIDNWLPPEGGADVLVSEAEKDQGEKARSIIMKITESD
jgi:hypothetical protein